MPELGTYEAFCVDEACAYVYGVEQKRLLDEAKAGHNTSGGDKKTSKTVDVADPLAWMTQGKFAATK